MLLAVFKMFCFVSKLPNPSVEMAPNGTMSTVTQNCRYCGPMKRFKRTSQPVVLGRHPAGNLLLSFVSITSGVYISQMLLLFKHMGLCSISGSSTAMELDSAKKCFTFIQDKGFTISAFVSDRHLSLGK